MSLVVYYFVEWSDLSLFRCPFSLLILPFVSSFNLYFLRSIVGASWCMYLITVWLFNVCDSVPNTLSLLSYCVWIVCYASIYLFIFIAYGFEEFFNFPISLEVQVSWFFSWKPVGFLFFSFYCSLCSFFSSVSSIRSSLWWEQHFSLLVNHVHVYFFLSFFFHLSPLLVIQFDWCRWCI